VFNVSASTGAPTTTGDVAHAVEDPVILDAKVGELNGRAIRAQGVLDELGPLLSAKARERKFTQLEWEFLLYPRKPEPGAENKTISREQWLAFCQRRIGFQLNQELEDQLLAEEARFSLKPEQKQGLKYLVQEAAENARRREGSHAAAQERMRREGMSEREFTRKQESEMLVGYEVSEKIRKRIRTSWKDVQLYYQRNPQEFNPPPVAHFRRIDVPAAKPDDIAAIQAALDAGRPFDEVSKMPQNTYHRADGGRTPDQTFAGDYDQATFFSGALADAARTLKPGAYTHTPFDLGSDKTWLYLESIDAQSRPLSDQTVQLVIANRLFAQAFKAEKDNYIDKLKQRATFTAIPDMASQLTDVAAARYWPKE
jgi:hypothetical protein